MSKSPKSHSYDRIASDALRNVFPKTWLWKSPRDVDSGREHGEDWIIEIVDDNETVTGAEFSVQNKGNPQVHEEYVSVPDIKLTTLERLIGLNRPVLLHAYDIPSKTSYWLWLDEWYAAAFTPEWKAKRRKTITVRVPRQNILDEATVQNLYTRIMWEHRKSKAVKIANLINQTSSDFRIDVHTDEQSITTVINPKHEGAIPTVRPLDEAANQAMIYALQMGQAVQVNGRFAIEGGPSLLSEANEIEVVQAIIWPVIEAKEFPLKVEFLDEHGNVIYKTPHVNMRLVQPGTVVQRWVGESADQFLTYTMNADYREKAAGFGVQFHCKTHSVKEWSDFYEVIEKLKNAKHTKLTNLQTEYTNSIDVLGISTKADPDDLKYWKDFLHELLSIETALGIGFNLPDNIPGEEYIKARVISKALKTGFLSVDSHAIVPEGYALIIEKIPSDARLLIEEADKSGSINLWSEEVIEVKVELIGQVLSLGKGRWEFPGSVVLNGDSIKAGLDGASADAKVYVPFQIDRQKSCIRLFEWGEQSTDEAGSEGTEV